MAGKGWVGATYSKVGHNQYDVAVNFQIAFDYGGWNRSGASYTIYCNGQSQSGKATFSISSGGGSWVWGNIATKTFRVTMPSSGNAHNISISAGINTGIKPSYIDASATVTLPALTWQWTVSYNANGGSGAPGSQTKNYGSNLTLSKTKPTRPGYIFQGWATSASGGVAYQPGGTYSSNSSTTLYAVWKIITYSIKFNPNGGSGGPTSQTKTHGTNLKISTSIPTRTNYNFKGWGSSADSSTVLYKAGDYYTKDSNATLYAVWEIAYIPPRITNIEVDRCLSDGTLSDEGTYARVKFSWETDKTVQNVNVSCDTYSDNLYATGTGGSHDVVIGNGLIDTEKYYTVKIKITDASGSTDVSRTVEPMRFTIDVKKGGDGVSFGKPASRPGFDVHMNSYFDKNIDISGPLAIHHIPILSNTDLNTITTPGNYGCYDAEAGTLLNCPVQKGFHMEVGYAYNGTNYIYQEITGGLSAVKYYRRCFVSSNAWSEWRIRSAVTQLATSTDLNVVDTPGVYYSAGGNPNSPSKLAANTTTFMLEVYPGGTNGQIIQRLSDCNDIAPFVAERAYYMGSWHKWVTISQAPKVLWSGGYYMSGGHVINLSEKVSDQAHGIVLVFSEYTGSSPSNTCFSYHFVPKEHVSLYHGCGTEFNLCGAWYTGFKYLYIYDTKISGNDININQVSVGGITADNRKYVLREVFGV